MRGPPGKRFAVLEPIAPKLGSPLIQGPTPAEGCPVTEVRPNEQCAAEKRPAEGRPAEVCPVEVRPAQVRHCVRFAPRRFTRSRPAPSEVRAAAAHRAEVRCHVGIILLPPVPSVYPLLENPEVFWVGHGYQPHEGFELAWRDSFRLCRESKWRTRGRVRARKMLR